MRGSFAARTYALKPQHPPVRRLIRTAAGKIVESFLGDADDMGGDEFSAFAGAVLRMLQRAFSFDHGPAVEIIGRHLREYGAEIDLAVAERTESARRVPPSPGSRHKRPGARSD